MKARVIPILCGSALILLGACAHRVPSPSPVRPAEKTLSYEAKVKRVKGPESDTVRVIGTARNISGKPMEICGRFDFQGQFVPASDCSKLERPPVLYLLPRSTPDTSPLECHAVTLPPDGVFRDSLDFPVYRADFVPCPGSVRVTLSFWTGRPGQTFREARCIAPAAVGVSVAVP